MSSLVSNTNFTDIAVFASEIKNAFKTTIPPVCISFDTKESVEQYIQPFLGEKGYIGKRVSCKHAKSGSFSNFTVNEIYAFEAERYPIQLSFKQLAEFEDFAKGWSRAIEKENAPAEEAASKMPPAQEAPKPEEKKPFSEEFELLKGGVYQTVIRLNSLSDIKSFTDALKQEVSLEGVSGNVDDTLFTCRMSVAGIPFEKNFHISEFSKNFPLSIILNGMEQAKQFAVVSDTYLAQDAVQEKVKIEEAKKMLEDNPALIENSTKYPVNPLAEKILDKVLKTGLTLSWLMGILAMFGGISAGVSIFVDGSEFEQPLGVALFFGGIIIGVIIILLAYYRWAQGKVQINISRNLYNINSKLKAK